MELLVDAGADLEARTDGMNQTALMLAARKGDLAMVKKLVNYGADLSPRIKDVNGNTAMALAGFAGHKEVEDWLRKAMTHDPRLQTDSNKRGR